MKKLSKLPLNCMKNFTQVHFFQIVISKFLFLILTEKLVGLVLLKGPKEMKYIRDEFITEEKGTISLDWVEGDYKEDTPIVFIQPGSTGNSTRSYMLHTAGLFYEKGYRAVCFNIRGSNCDLTVRFFVELKNSKVSKDIFIWGH
jgi:predicted alpha/beta-fold hydrolase